MAQISSKQSKPPTPIHAQLLIVGAWLLVTFQVAVGGMLGVGFIPLSPIVLFGGACLLSSVHQYAREAALAAARGAAEKDRRGLAFRPQRSTAV